MIAAIRNLPLAWLDAIKRHEISNLISSPETAAPSSQPPMPIFAVDVKEGAEIGASPPTIPAFAVD